MDEEDSKVRGREKHPHAGGRAFGEDSMAEALSGPARTRRGRAAGIAPGREFQDQHERGRQQREAKLTGESWQNQ